MTDYDATAHIAEEIQNAAVRAPQAIASALFLTYSLGFLFSIVLGFTMGDIENLLSSPTAQPFTQIFYNVLGKCPNYLCFSRDELLSFSKVWIRIISYTQTPLIAVWLNATLAVSINLIGLGSYTAIAAIFNVCAIALDWSYCIPIICKLIYGTETGRYIPGPWNLGKFSTPINCWSVIWTAFVSVIFLMPTNQPVTVDNMNYAVVILIGILVFAMIYWFVCGAQKYYIGPRTNQHWHKEKDNSWDFVSSLCENDQVTRF
ncbi:unnamed protein product [Rotaria socialis]|uniref:Amino acid transporter n=1 Tax=Rotaria socialis TaxID=392032 RepID=A0A818MT79_9BILA|nr:unnamed protein product [Rotaria socialis]CAF4513560.1 unnamed protein product [Rotaria socialis]